MKDIRKMLKEIPKLVMKQKIAIPDSVKRAQQAAQEASITAKIAKGRRV